MKKVLSNFSFALFIFLVTLYSCQKQKETNNSGGKTMKIFSSAFSEGTLIPKKFTCDDINISPPLEWSEVPEGTKTFALICDDPDAPMGTWVHWVLFNLPASVHELSENIPPIDKLPNGALQGKNDFRKTGYGGPCPPGGTHRYYFKLYALDVELDTELGITKSELLDKMQGHILAEAQLMGKYQRQ